jgi:hypothetical protein
MLLSVVSNVLVRPLSGPSREFWYGLFLAFGALAVKLAYDAWSSPDAGAPLVRLFARIDWPSALVAALIAIGCFHLCQRLVFPNPIIGYSLGFGAGVTTGMLAGMVIRDKIYLCENGVVLVRWPFLPWKRVRVIKWQRDGKKALLLGSGWRRIRARVPQEHREFVDRVLREKLKSKNASAVGVRTQSATVNSE